MKKKFACIALSAALAFSLLPSAFAADGSMDNFTKSRTYTQGQFTDVPAGQWYTSWVAEAYELGLMSGTGTGTFSPGKNISVVESLAIACNINSIYTGKTVTDNGGKWYQKYLDYASGLSFSFADEFSSSDYLRPATRAEFAHILAGALPVSELAAINDIQELPDMDSGDAYYEDVLLLYNAGILSGSDEYGTFAPDTAITRNAVCSIAARIAEPGLRTETALSPKPVFFIASESHETTTPAGTTSSSTTYAYDENGDCISRYTSKSGGTYSSYTYTYTYDENGLLTEVITETDNGTRKQTSSTVTTYDDQGRTAVVTVTGSDGKQEISTYSYPDDYGSYTCITSSGGPSTKEVVTCYSDGSIKTYESTANYSTVRTTYDENGNILTDAYTTAGGISNVYIYQYDAKGIQTGYTWEVGNEKHTVTNTYDANGYLSAQKDVCETESGSYTDSYTYQYDASGNCIRKTCAGNTTSTETYTYDAGGNCTGSSCNSSVNGESSSFVQTWKYDSYGNLLQYESTKKDSIGTTHVLDTYSYVGIVLAGA